MKEFMLKRRDFIKATAVTGFAAMFGGSFKKGLTAEKSAKTEADFDTKIVKTCCRACIHNCGVLAHVKNGRVIKLEGNPEYPMTKGAMCAKGLSGIQALYHPNRNKYPMMRVGARGENKWKRISWDEALDTIAKKLMETREKYGAESVFCSTGGGGNPEFWSIARFCNAFDTPNWFEPGCAQCYLPRTLAFNLMYGGPDTSIADSNALEIYDEETPMKGIVLWGTDPSYSCPAGGGQALVELRDRGVHTIVIDPRLTPDAAKADIWLCIRPGSDVALMLAWVRYIIDKKAYDRDFVMKWTNLPYLVDVKTKMFLRVGERHEGKGASTDTFMVWDTKTNSAQPLVYPWNDNLKPALEGTFTVDGVECKTAFQLLKERAEPYTLEKAAELCWLDAGKIEEAIKLYIADSPVSGMCLGVATDQGTNSVQAGQGCVVLNALMGNVERPGNLMQRFPNSRGDDSPVGTYIVPVAHKLLSEKQLKKRLGSIEHKGLLQWWTGQPTAVMDAVVTGKPYKPRTWIERSGNKFAMIANSSYIEKVIEQCDFIVHMYMYPTSFSCYADVLLPAEEWLETDMPVDSCNMLFARQAVTHLWETMDETVFWSKLAKRCADMGHENCKKAFDAEYMGKDLPYWSNMRELIEASVHMKWEDYLAKTPCEFMPKKDWKTYYVYESIDPKTGLPKGFNTPSKKLELYTESLLELGRTGKPYTTYPLPPASKDYDPLFYYLEPTESPIEGDLRNEFPLVLTSGRVPFFHHGTLRNSPWMREIYPVPEVWINPGTAAKYGISQGDWVNIESKRGKIAGKAWLTEGMHPGVVYMERFWNPETLNTETHGWKEMNVNVLTKNDAPFNDVVGTYTLRGFLVKVSKKTDGAPKGIWTKPEQFKEWLPEPSDRTKDFTKEARM